ncbi:type IV secretory system conjugative DNA transfer family protein [Mobilicoccus caccae]|uniref:type IV secretory system conjugative DNA transfer family protein n=1 Tax=Mobilicoccus caccae TaxID=1859295 RepID=UPI0024E1284B|nr:type IV secretion system DNA-binding domain-containing protein [Mobilicoccus caccae]
MTLAGLVLLPLLFGLGAGRIYVSPWREMAAVVARGGLMLRDGGAVRVLGGLVQERWLLWLWGQIPLGIGMALVICGLVLSRRRRFRPTWRVHRPDYSTHLTGTKAAKAHERAKKIAASPPASTTDAAREQDDEQGSSSLVARLAARVRRTQGASRPGEAGTWTDSAALFGIDEAGEPVLWRGSWFLSHVVVTGPTGLGKTTTLLRLLWIALLGLRGARIGVVLIDLKGSKAFARSVKWLAALADRRCAVVSLSGPSAHVNPLRHGSSQEVTSRLMEALATMKDGGFSDPYHRSNGLNWLRMSLQALDQLIERGLARKDGTQWKRTLGDLLLLMEVEELARIRPQLVDPVKAKVGKRVARAAKDRDYRSSVGGMIARIETLAESEAGRLSVEDEHTVDIDTFVREAGVLVFSLDAQVDADSARALSTLVVKDLTRLFAQLDDEEWPDRTGGRTLLMLDEFGAIGGETLRDCFERSRSGGGCTILSAQTDAAFSAVSDEFAESVWDNAGIHILHRQRGSASARAEHIGTEASWQETIQVTEDSDIFGSVAPGTGVGSLRRVEEFIVHPKELRKLGTGQVILVEPEGVHRVAVTKIDDLPGEDSPEAPSGESNTPDEDAPDTSEQAAPQAPSFAELFAAPPLQPRVEAPKASTTAQASEEESTGDEDEEWIETPEGERIVF